MNKASDMHEHDLDNLFAEMRAQPLADSTALIARVLADAERYQPQPHAAFRPASVQRQPGFWATLAEAMGGRRVLAGLGTVAVAGVMLGFVQPSSLAALTDTIFTQAPLDEVDLIPGIDAILIEG